MSLLRWGNYFLKRGNDCLNFWDAFIREKERDILYIMAIGFDPRTSNGLQKIFSFGPSGGKREVIGIRYFSTEAKNDPEHPGVVAHVSQIEEFLISKSLNGPMYKDLILRSGSDTSISSRNAAYNIINDVSDIERFTDVILDISAMPRSIFISLANKLLSIIEGHNFKEGNKTINLHLVATENSHLDSKIIEQGIEEDASFIHGFTISDIAKTTEYKKVWIPILGENQKEQFIRIRNAIQPDEICPILPFPSMDLRRGDELLNYYQDVLFSDSAFNIRNVLYADESNPFQTYRLLVNTIDRYKISFDLINGCKIYLSTLSSKLLSIGTFLAAYEAKQQQLSIGILHVESRGHKLVDSITEKELKNISEDNNLFEIWLAGEAYDQN